MTRASDPPQESEVALLIWSRQPQRAVERIAGLSSIAGYRLVPGDPLEMRDLYFDTRDRLLEPPRLALRVREFGATRLLALKGPSKPTDWGGVERLEIEEPWSADALTTVLGALADRGIEVTEQQDFAEGCPRKVLADLGLQVIQDRETRRQVRCIVRADGECGPTLAELVIDSVLYRVDSHEMRHYEVEIEARTDTGIAQIASVAAALKAMLGDELRAWDHSKLAIGFALEDLLARGDLEGLLDLYGNLTPAAYDRIDELLRETG